MFSIKKVVLPKFKALAASTPAVPDAAAPVQSVPVETAITQFGASSSSFAEPDAVEPISEQRVSPEPAETTALSSAAARLAPDRIVSGVARRIWRYGRSSIDFTQRTGAMLRSPKVAARNIVRSMVDKGDITFFGLNGTAARQVSRLEFNRSIQRHLLEFGERTDLERKGKLKYLADVISHRQLDRARFFREMVRLERLRGDDLIAATYGLRIIRWFGHDQFRLLGFIQDALKAHGFTREAEAAQAMYGEPARAEERCRAILDDQLQRHRLNPDRSFEIVDDRRGKRTGRVSIVVSLYNAASKLPAFWAMLRQQTLVKSGEAEVVFVDSGSPSDEYAIFQDLSSRYPLPAVYARSKNRETIQMAWNRGINLTKGAYLAFLGVDEGVHPDCYSILAAELDQNPSVDWVIADSIVTEVLRAASRTDTTRSPRSQTASSSPSFRSLLRVLALKARTLVGVTAMRKVLGNPLARFLPTVRMTVPTIGEMYENGRLAKPPDL